MTLPPIPDPMLKVVENATPFPHMAFRKMGKGRLFYDVIVCRMTFKLAPGVLEFADDQQALVVADQYHNADDPENSSLQAVGDTVLTKPGCDIFITGTARHAETEAKTDWLAGLRVSAATGERLIEHPIRFLGPRFWEYIPLRGWRISEPQSVREIPLRHELGFGGRRPAVKDGKAYWQRFERNPVGRGYLDTAHLEKDQLYPAPQIELPRQPITTMDGDYPLVCPAPIPPFWADRANLAGTYDSAWQEQAKRLPIPDFPSDFDNRHFQCAIPGLLAPTPLGGNEILHLVGMTRETKVVAMQLPGVSLSALLVRADNKIVARPLQLDTLHLDLDTHVVSATWRLPLDQRECVVAARILPSRQNS